MFKKRRPPTPPDTMPDSIAPWEMLHEDEIASVSVRLREDDPERHLTAFARRVDTGAFACFDRGQDGAGKSIVVLKHDGSEKPFPSFSAWFDQALKDAHL